MSMERYVELNSEALADDSDKATRRETLAIMDSLEANEAKLNRPLRPEFDGVHCIDCDDEIPKERLQAVHTDQCVHCANAVEVRKKFYIN